MGLKESSGFDDNPGKMTYLEVPSDEPPPFDLFYRDIQRNLHHDLHG